MEKWQTALRHYGTINLSILDFKYRLKTGMSEDELIYKSIHIGF